MQTPFDAARERFVEGLAHFEGGRFDAAEASFRASLTLLPGRPSTLTNLGATLLKLARPADALPALQQALAAEPDNPEALAHHADALSRLGRHADALPSLTTLLAVQPGHAGSWLRHAQTLVALDRHADALPSFDRALALDATLAGAWSDRGGILKDSGRHAEAALSFQRALDHGADPELHRWLLASVTGTDAPATAPPSYVQALFDSYAGDFEQHLVERLHYRAHTALVAPLAASGRRFASALDLGCGTGLCGRLLRPHVSRLTGVDLSRRMLDTAAAGGAYDTLVQAELLAHLQASGDCAHDLVLAADTFIYVGDLAPVFAAVRRVLSPGGLFAFTAEAAAGGAGFELRPSSRYAHGEDHLRRLAAEHAFDVVEMEHGSLREEQRRPVDGLYVTLRHGASRQPGTG